MTEEKSDKAQSGMSPEEATSFVIAAVQSGALPLPHVQNFVPNKELIEGALKNGTQVSLQADVREAVIKLDAPFVLAFRQALIAGL